MSGLLAGRIAVITGAGSGIGRAIALGYAKEGARVVVLDANAETAAQTVTSIEAEGGSAWSFKLDVADQQACRRLAPEIAQAAGQVSILVNNAGINRRNAFTAAPEAVINDWQDIMAVNLNGVFNVTHAFLDQLRRSQGRIINIGSIQSFVHVRTPNSPAYTTSKHGVLGFTRALAAELGKDGVRVNAIGPGLIETPLNAEVRGNNPELVRIFLEHTPLGRPGKPEDIVGPAIFLASDLSAYVTGAIVMVDGAIERFSRRQRRRGINRHGQAASPSLPTRGRDLGLKGAEPTRHAAIGRGRRTGMAWENRRRWRHKIAARKQRGAERRQQMCHRAPRHSLTTFGTGNRLAGVEHPPIVHVRRYREAGAIVLDWKPSHAPPARPSHNHHASGIDNPATAPAGVCAAALLGLGRWRRGRRQRP
jgi:NAD(P)-dependent dehydrogenase (short-subunit alcohol dehydrogenase family)